MRVRRRGVVALALVGALAAACDPAEPPAAQPPASTSPLATPLGIGPPPTEPTLPSPVAATGAPLPTAAGLSHALAAGLSDRSVAGRLAVVVSDPDSGAMLLDRGGALLVTPASTAKIATAVAALAALGPQHRLRTRVVRASDGTVVLVGGGDPTLAGPAAAPAYPAPARLADLATETARVLGARAGTRVAVHVAVDASRWSGPPTGPGWRSGYLVSGNVAPVQALSVDAGRVRPDRAARHSNPALAAGRAFAALLTRAGVRVTGPVANAPAPGPGADRTEIAHVDSPPVAALVERMLGASDNDLAEALAREVAVRRTKPPTFAGAAAGVREALAALGVDVTGLRLVDGSGLSRDDRLQPRLLARLLALAASPQHPQLRAVVTGLPIARFSGTLRARFSRPPARAGAGLVRAKTGTLLGVSSLAGLAVDADGRLLAFALVADGVPAAQTLIAQATLDRLAATLTACGCR